MFSIIQIIMIDDFSRRKLLVAFHPNQELFLSVQKRSGSVADGQHVIDPVVHIDIVFSDELPEYSPPIFHRMITTDPEGTQFIVTLFKNFVTDLATQYFDNVRSTESQTICL